MKRPEDHEAMLWPCCLGILPYPWPAIFQEECACGGHESGVYHARLVSTLGMSSRDATFGMFLIVVPVP